MKKSDGTVYIDTKIDTSGVDSGVDNVKRKINSVSSSVKKMGEDLKRSLSGTSAGNAGRAYEEIEKDIRKAEAQLDRLIEKQIRFVEIGGNRKSQAFAGMEYDIEMARNKLFELQDELSKTEKTAPKSTNVLKKGIDNASKSIKKLGNNAKRSNYSLLKMLGTSVLFSFVFRAISGMMQGFASGLNNLVQYSDEANKTISSLKSSMTQLKNSFATAFMPIITIVAPILNSLIALIIKANNVIAQFFAALSGKSTYTKAISVQEDYAASLNDTADAAKNAKNNLSGLDELTIVSNDQGGAGGAAGGVTPGEMFEEVPIDNGILDFLERTKEAIREVADIFKAGFLDGLGDAGPRLKIIEKGLNSIKKSLAEIFNDPGVNAAAEKWANSFIYSLGQIAGSIASVGLTMGANLIGGFALYLEENKGQIKEYLIDMFNIGAEINALVGQIFDTFAYIFEAFASGEGIELTSNLIGIFAEMFMGITNLLGLFALDVVKLLTLPFIQSAEQIKGTLQGLLGNFSTTFELIKQVVSDAFGFLSTIYTEIITPIFDNLILRLTEILQEHLLPLFAQVGEFIGLVSELLLMLWETVLQPLIQWIIDNILPVVTPIINTIVNLISDAVSLILGLVQSVMQVLNGLLTFLKGVFTAEWGTAWDGIKNIVLGIINSLNTVIEAFANAAIDLLNGLAGGLNNFTGIFGVPAIPTIPRVSIPRLATGAVIPPNAPFVAMLGDQKHGTNIEAPLDTIKQAVAEVMASTEMLDLLSQIAQNTRDTADKELTIGDREIAKANLRGQSSMGYTLIVEG